MIELTCGDAALTDRVADWKSRGYPTAIRIRLVIA
jgi:hypothetical protein